MNIHCLNRLWIAHKPAHISEAWSSGSFTMSPQVYKWLVRVQKIKFVVVHRTHDVLINVRGNQGVILHFFSQCIKWQGTRSCEAPLKIPYCMFSPLIFSRLNLLPLQVRARLSFSQNHRWSVCWAVSLYIAVTDQLCCQTMKN